MPSRPGPYDLLALVTVVVAGVVLFIAGARATDLSTAALAMSTLYGRWRGSDADPPKPPPADRR